MLCKNDRLTSLDLASNSLHEGCAQLIAQALETNTAILKLSLSSNNLRAAGALAIGDMLHHNRTCSNLNPHASTCGMGVVHRRCLRATKENRPFLCGPGFRFVGSSICGGPQIFVGLANICGVSYPTKKNCGVSYPTKKIVG